jgi:hypothetical protein
MANRSYLYSSNFVPSPDANEVDRRMTGIAEWNYDIPIAFKVLLSGNPRKCRSSIWEVPEEIAIVGDYDLGLARLFRFLDRIPLPEVVPLKEEARRFLTDEANKNRYFVLECGEIFEMDEVPLSEQNDRLLAEVRNIEPLVEAVLANLSPSQPTTAKPRGFLSRLLGREPPAVAKKASAAGVDSVGLGNWSNILYFDLRQPRQQPDEAPQI